MTKAAEEAEDEGQMDDEEYKWLWRKVRMEAVIPDAPCMEYLPTFNSKNGPNVTRYSIHGAYGHGIPFVMESKNLREHVPPSFQCTTRRDDPKNGVTTVTPGVFEAGFYMSGLILQAKPNIHVLCECWIPGEPKGKRRRAFDLQ